MKTLISLLLSLLLTACGGSLNLINDQRSTIPTAVEKPFKQGLASLRAKKYRAAERLFKRVISMDKTLPGAYLNMAIAQTHLNREAEAMVAVEKLLKLDANHAAGLNQQGILLRRSGEFQAAKDAYKKALKINPKYILAQLNLGVLCDLYLNEPSCALQAYRQFQKLSVKDDPKVAAWIIGLERRKP